MYKKLKGRLMNRLSSDLLVVDNELISNVRFFVAAIFLVISTVIKCGFIMNASSIPCVILFFIFAMIVGNYYRYSARELIRIGN